MEIKRLKELIKFAYQNKNQKFWLDFIIIDINKLLTKIEFDFSEYNLFVIAVSDIRHTLLRHGKKTEKKQVAVSFDDFLLIPKIIKKFDDVKLSGYTKKTNLKTIKFTKNINKINYVCIFEIRTGRKKLAFKTLYKKKLGKNPSL